MNAPALSVELLTAIAAAGTAAALSSHVFDLIREQLPEGRIRALLSYRAIARIAVLALACLVSSGAFALRDLVLGQPVTVQLDQALIGALLSQVYHALGYGNSREGEGGDPILFTPGRASDAGSISGADRDAPWFFENEFHTPPEWLRYWPEDDENTGKGSK